MGLYSGGLIFGRAYIREGLLSEGFLRLRFGGLFSGGQFFFLAYYRNFTVIEKSCLYGGHLG